MLVSRIYIDINKNSPSISFLLKVFAIFIFDVTDMLNQLKCDKIIKSEVLLKILLIAIATTHSRHLIHQIQEEIERKRVHTRGFSFYKHYLYKMISTYLKFLNNLFYSNNKI